jgi:hypothetical protein
MTPSTKVLAIFCLAGLFSSLTYTSYSAWVSSLPKADAESHQMGLDDLRSPNYDPAKVYERRYAENIRLTKYYDRKWPIFCFSFPVAMSLALLIAAGAGWLQRVSAPVMFCALIPVYVAPGLVLALCAVSWFILLIPSLALAGYLLRWSVEIYTSHRPRRLVLTLLIASVCCSVLYLVTAAMLPLGRDTFASAMFIIAMEMIAAGLYGKALTPSSGFVARPATVSRDG